jgi:hypothetical protein
VLLRNIHLWIKTGTTPTQKGQETDYPFRKSSISCCSVIKFLEPRVSQFRAMKETNIKNVCCSRIIKYFCSAQKSLLLFRAVHRNKQKYFDAFALLWDDTKSTNCPGRANFANARYMKSFSIYNQRKRVHSNRRALWYMPRQDSSFQLTKRASHLTTLNSKQPLDFQKDKTNNIK